MIEPLHCGDCGSVMVLRRGVIGGSKSRSFWGCSSFPKCRSTHGAHQRTGEPLGIPADAETRAARKRAHLAFDAIWQGGSMTRAAAYGWMRGVLGLTRDEAHIAKFTKGQCDALIAALEKRRGKRSANALRGER